MIKNDMGKLPVYIGIKKNLNMDAINHFSIYKCKKRFLCFRFCLLTF
eukprot:UN22010